MFGAACPCDCKEISTQKTVYFSRTAAGSNSKAVRVPVKKTVCNTTPGKVSYQWNCADDLARLAAALNATP